MEPEKDFLSIGSCKQYIPAAPFQCETKKISTGLFFFIFILRLHTFLPKIPGAAEATGALLWLRVLRDVLARCPHSGSSVLSCVWPLWSPFLPRQSSPRDPGRGGAVAELALLLLNKL